MYNIKEGTLTRATQNYSKLFLYLVEVVLLAGVYFGTAKAGLSLSPVSGFATLVWPPSGIALVALFLYGGRLWPGIFVGATLTNFTTGAPLLVAMGIGLGNTLEPAVGAYLLRRFNFQTRLNRIQDIVLLVGCAALFSTLISATIGTFSLLFGGTITLSAYPKTWIAWWIGDMLGDLIVAPFLLVWVQNHKIKLSLKRLIEALVITSLLLVLGAIIFGYIFTKTSSLNTAPYLLFPLLIWAAIRFRVRMVVTLNLGLSALTVLAAIHNLGPFVGKTLSARLFSSQLFIGITAVTFLLFSAAISEWRRGLALTYRLNQQLSKTLNRRTYELRKEKEIEKLKDEFVAVASHELKTPITSIKAYTDVLDKKLTKSMDKEAAQLASRIDRQADKLTRLSEELLDVSRIESGKLVLYKSKFDLSKLIEKIVVDIQYITKSHKIIKQIEKGQQITGDQNRLEQVILNLLTNAIKYSTKADKVIIRLSTKPGLIIVSVQDFGPGIPKKDTAKIFKRFYRTADNSKGKQAVSGLGLGLYIAAEIIRRHGGKIWAESKIGKGSIFSFSLPLK